jgi:hypothetical protein
MPYEVSCDCSRNWNDRKRLLEVGHIVGRSRIAVFAVYWLLRDVCAFCNVCMTSILLNKEENRSPTSFPVEQVGEGRLRLYCLITL